MGQCLHMCRHRHRHQLPVEPPLAKRTSDTMELTWGFSISLVLSTALRVSSSALRPAALALDGVAPYIPVMLVLKAAQT